MPSIPLLVGRDGADQDCWNAMGFNTSWDLKELKTHTFSQASSKYLDYDMRGVK